MSRRSTSPSVYRASTSPGSSSIRSSTIGPRTVPSGGLLAPWRRSTVPSVERDQRRQVPRVRVRERPVVGVEHRVDARDDVVVAELADRAVQVLEHVGGWQVEPGVRPHGGAQLPHHGRGLHAAPHHVAQDEGGAAGPELDDVVPVAADLCALDARRGSTSRAAGPRPRRRRPGAGRAAARSRSCARGRRPRPRRRPRHRPLRLALDRDVLVAPPDEHDPPVGVPLDLRDRAEDAHLAAGEHVALLVVERLARHGRTLDERPDASLIVGVDPLGDDVVRAARSRELLGRHPQLARQFLRRP